LKEISLIREEVDVIGFKRSVPSRGHVIVRSASGPQQFFYFQGEGGVSGKILRSQVRCSLDTFEALRT